MLILKLFEIGSVGSIAVMQYSMFTFKNDPFFILKYLILIHISSFEIEFLFFFIFLDAA